MIRERVWSYRLGFILLQACGYSWNKRYLDVLGLLLEAGSDVNVGLDRVGNGSLHLVSGLNNSKLSEVIACLLVESGAHVDRVHKAEKTATDAVWIETCNRQGAGAVPYRTCCASQLDPFESTIFPTRIQHWLLYTLSLLCTK